MTNPLSPRFTGLIRDVRTSKRYLQQTLSQVFFFIYYFSHHPSQSFHPSQQQLHRQLQLMNNGLFHELVHHQDLLLVQFHIKHHQKQMKCQKQIQIVRHTSMTTMRLN
jgi:hypothetical protein